MESQQVDTLFDYVDLMRARIGIPIITTTTIVVPIHNLAVFSGFPSYPDGKLFAYCKLIFEHVKSLKRTLYEYADNPRVDSFKPPRFFVDGPFQPVYDKICHYEMEGVSEELNAYVVFELEAASFRIEEQIDARNAFNSI